MLKKSSTGTQIPNYRVQGDSVTPEPSGIKTAEKMFTGNSLILDYKKIT